MINEDIPDIFRRMDAMIAQLMAGMEAGFPAGAPRGIVGYRIVIRGGDLPPNPTGSATPLPRDAGEPVAEVHRIEDEVKVIVELPGVSEESVRLDLHRKQLIIDAGDADRHYRTSATLPAVDPSSMRTTLKNGVLEVTFTACPEEPGLAE